jgi:SAM-dependent methyltransferase
MAEIEESDKPSATARNPLADRLFRAAVGMFDLLTLYIGERLGLYRALAEHGPATPAELADRTGTQERYVREWLEQQAVSAILEVDDPSAAPETRRYSMPPEHVEVLTNQDSINYEAHKGIDMVRAARPLPALVEAFRTGGGLPPLPWEPEGRAEFNRALFLNLLGRKWLPSIPDVHRRLRDDPPARIADLGCGTGWSSIAVAQAYPKVAVDGFDLDEDVIAVAGENAKSAGVEGQVHFFVLDVANLSGAERYDLVMILEALHDMSRPVEVLRTVRGLLAEGGSILVADERVGDTFTAPGDEFERYAYGWSVVSCLPSAMGDPESAGTGAVMRPATLRRYAIEAGFREAKVLPIDDRQWRFYQLLP